MKQKYQILFILTILFCMALCACGGSGDWRYDKLPGGYEIWRINSRSIILCMPDNTGTLADTIIDAYITQIANNNDYIFAQQVSVPDNLKEKIDESNPSFYILKVDDGKLYGPYTEVEFNTKCTELNIKEIKWMKTSDLDKSQ